MQELPKAYEPQAVEHDIYDLWEKHEVFTPADKSDAKPFCIINPPTNANGVLHIGHAVGVSLQDLMVRYHRMKGDVTLWLPGFDHAGFETQVVYEKQLEKEGRSRFQVPREQLYNEMYEFTQGKIDLMKDQFAKLGASLDWSRYKFTLDPKVVEIVYKTFKDLYDDDLVYRGERPINWCVKHQTGLADLETVYEERTDPLYYFKYGPFTIATARPETKFGDKYVVMHPGDPRYTEYHDGQQLEVEWINGLITATVIKDDAIDMKFGTGVMTITPWHDPIDFEIAKRHNLSMEQIIDLRGKLLPIAGEFAGQKITEARPLIVEKLKSKGLLVKVDENYRHSVQLCYKCKNLIEPQVKKQWFIAMTKTGKSGKNLRDDAVAVVKSGKVKFVTKKYETTFYRWMENLRDWNISHQIVWGIQLPIWYCSTSLSSSTGSPPAGGDAPDRGSKCEPIVTDGTPPTKCPTCGNAKLERDPDVFNTWFSSGQWPYAALKAQDDYRLPTTDYQKKDAVDSSQLTVDRQDFEHFYPTSVMETAYDILFFWVARMLMLCQYITGEVPFQNIYIHGLVRDKDRQKMSKSKGNVIDPLGVAEQYGSDAVRLALIFGTSAGNDIVIAEDKIKGMRNFANKLWNIARFILMNLETDKTYTLAELSQVKPITKPDTIALRRFGEVTEQITKQIESFQFHLAAETLYDFIWHQFADIYLEETKAQLADNALADNTRKILLFALLRQITLLHPFMPFVTEAIYQSLPISDKPAVLATVTWPEA